MIEDEKEIIERAKSGEKDAFGALYDHYQPQIYRFVLLKIGDKAEAEDITHQVFLSAYENVGGYRENGNPFGSWLYEIARNRVTDHYRLAKADFPLPDEDSEIFAVPAGLPDAVDEHFNLEKVRGALVTLRPEYQDVIIMRFVEELSLEETAANLEKTVGAVKLLQHRAIHALRNTLANS
jgi:RNA polymerase sigma-70 factor (ECF subfamily)